MMYDSVGSSLFLNCTQTMLTLSLCAILVYKIFHMINYREFNYKQFDIWKLGNNLTFKPLILDLDRKKSFQD